MSSQRWGLFPSLAGVSGGRISSLPALATSFRAVPPEQEPLCRVCCVVFKSWKTPTEVVVQKLRTPSQDKQVSPAKERKQMTGLTSERTLTQIPHRPT